MLAIRVLLAWTLYRYGWAKLTDGQFGIDSKSMELPLKDLDLFRLSWYMADHQPFKAFIGVSQLLAAALLTFNRTYVLGALMSIPIWLNILVWDMTFMEGMTSAFTFRLSFYLTLTFILIYDAVKDKRVLIAMLTQNTSIAKHPFWLYVTLPIAALALELVGATPNAILNWFTIK